MRPPLDIKVEVDNISEDLPQKIDELFDDVERLLQ